MKRADILIAVGLLALAGLLFLARSTGAGTVYINGEIMHESAHINDVAVEIDENRARIAGSPCRDQICVRAGWLERPGELAVCLPQRVIVEMRGGRGNYDGIAY